ncbi:hypothetical protein ANO14919_035740 [Xylariales sp. No.14919]|nr:hypothetical protein ANO14919_035740 [Xylariales sp. No.14919]
MEGVKNERVDEVCLLSVATNRNINSSSKNDWTYYN